ncbi:hypothetical protein [Flavobacterium sp. K5-23]|uniref:hypothetical protein n=1 Tax=Flavobacterium sp. K5-23 TaxID=2746225 RepID=UPI00200E3FE8|nr:hypothetical protein [Flavobacterium sp. K5-23]UQD56165.1 hypothetical protein FLAK523_07075 [Flavobacterium sp. K5-23]
MKLLLIVPDGVAVRNYLYSSFIKELNNNGIEVMLYHQITDAAIQEVKKVQPNISKIRAIPIFIEKPKARLLRESLAYARLLYNSRKLKNPTIMAFWNRNQKSLKQKLLYRLAEILGRLISLDYSIILKLDKSYEREILKDPVLKKIKEDLDVLQPDCILNLHQRASISAPIIEIAKQKKIPTSTVIFSWDNVPKARLVSRYDNYFVWSELMGNELDLLYPDIKKEQIKVVGTPQFEFYFQDKYIFSKEIFFKKYGLDIRKKTICFSGNDMSSPYEANYLEDICEEIGEIEISQRPQILFRRCPVDKTKRFDKILDKFKGLVFSVDPDWRIENKNNSFHAVYPSINDISLLVNTVKHSDLVINFGSTMAHDFAVYDKPCLYLNYIPVMHSKYNVNEVYQFQHFKSMKGLDAVGWINQKEEITSKIHQAIEFPEKVGQDRKIWMQKIVNYPLQESSVNIAKQIKELCTSVS